ncbi:uncharacterized protein LOC126846643 [Adelges cooleyi]|uniref:uncharacterized protein LOC126846643 n=1 Tax=Adelges cooleyi TaxID=133065 RepID=UPI00218040B4|nr:uncharacterized protein LOC126846643 [Adelges cooleyi]
MQSEKLHPTEPVKTEGPSQTQATHSLNCSCEPDPIETEILNESYKHCRRWNRKNPRDGVTRVDFWYFIGKNQSDFGIIQQYYRDHPYILQGAFDLDGNGYGKLFKYICKKRGVTVKNWAENRKNRAEKESREMTGGFDWYHEE